MEETRILTTQELSKYLKLNEKTIIKMAQTKELPGFKIGSQWRFYLATIDEYLQDKIVKTPKDPLKEITCLQNGIFPLSRLTSESCINLNLKSQKADGILYELAEIARRNNITNSLETLLEQLKKREQMLPTSIGNGVAIPHPRNPNDDLFSSTTVIIGRSIKGIDFGAPDEKKVRLFFMACATDVIFHLNLLAKISWLLNTKKTIENFLAAKTKKDILKLLIESEKKYI